jgi:GT2 family glycosyltransferase
MTYEITSSIVVYKNDPATLVKAIDSFLQVTLFSRIYVVDNSPTDELRGIVDNDRVEYIFSGSNLGFGRAHNIVLKKILDISRYHLILNPDVYFGPGLIEELVEFLNRNNNVGQVMPLVLYPNGEMQYSGKLLPSPLNLIGRRFFGSKSLFEEYDRLFELRESGYNKLMNVPHLSGCFMLIRTDALKIVGLFDDRYFMYIEDVDLTRRIHSQFETIFYPERHIFHGFERGSYKSSKLLRYHILSAIKYFNKWGWFFDKERKIINQRVISNYVSRDGS